MRRVIDGPERDWLSAEQVCDYLGIGATRFRELVEAGLFPPPVVLGGKDRLQKWNWLDATAFMHLRSRGLLVLNPPAENGDAAEGHEATGRRRRRE